jgi:hypothetical protein
MFSFSPTSFTKIPLYLQGLTARQKAKLLISKKIEKPLNRLYRTDNQNGNFIGSHSWSSRNGFLDWETPRKEYERILGSGYVPVGAYKNLYPPDTYLQNETDGVFGMTPRDLPEAYSYELKKVILPRIFHRLPENRLTNLFYTREKNRENLAYYGSNISANAINAAYSSYGAYTISSFLNNLITGLVVGAVNFASLRGIYKPVIDKLTSEDNYTVPRTVEMKVRQIERLGVKTLYRLSSLLPNK